MTWLLILTAINHWYFHKLVDTARVPNLLIDTSGYPVVVFRDRVSSDARFIRVRWNGLGWGCDTLPDEIRSLWSSFYWVRMDRSCHLHITQSGGTDTIFFASETDMGWKFYIYPDSCRPIAFDVTVDGTPHMIIQQPLGFDSLGVFHLWMEGDTWASELFIDVKRDSIDAYQGDIRFDSQGNLHLATEAIFPHMLWYGFRDSLGWRIDTVDPVWEEYGDFCFSLCAITVDWWGTPYIYYYPFYDPPGIYKSKYAELTPFGWISEFTNMNNSQYAVTPDSAVHTVKQFQDTLWHVVRRGANLWETLECITPGVSGRLFADQYGYLHLIYSSKPGIDDLWYATTNPEIGITESSPQPKPGLVLVPANHGFWLTGYSGAARIYDPAGRLVLAREIRGKTLISPLRPGVYFVVAGKQRAKIAVR